MRKLMSAAAVAAVLVALALPAAPPGEAHEGHIHAGVPEFIDPEDGAAVRNPVVVHFGIADAPDDRAAAVAKAHEKMGGAHMHLLVDSDPPPPGEPVPMDDGHQHFMAGETEATLNLPPGRHTLQLLLAGEDHMPSDPPIVSRKLTITVEGGSPAAARASDAIPAPPSQPHRHKH
jgi:hypothetical protein